MNQLVEIIAKLSNSIGEMEEAAKEHFDLHELTLTQMHYLEVISALANPNITELATELHITKPTVTVAIDKLIDRGYVNKVQSDADRRSSHLHLTEKGEKINEMHEYAHQRFSELMQEVLAPDEIDELVVLLQKAVSNL